MNLPRIATNSALAALASPDETHEVHVIIRRITNQAPYTLRGRKRQYIVTRDHARNAHILKVPLSVWMAGCDPRKPVMENDSIAYDIQGTRTGLKSPLTFEFWPILQPAAAAASPEPAAFTAPSMILPIFREVLTRMQAPGIVIEALDLFEAGNADGLEALSDSLQLDHPQDINIAPPPPKPEAPKPAPESKPAPMTNAQRQALLRARKKAEKEAALAAEAAKLQTA